MNLANKIQPSVDDPTSNISRVNNNLFMTPTTADEILKIVNGLKNKTSYGFDGISNTFVKDNIDTLAHPLTHVMNLSLSEAYVPNDMKLSKVIPLYKKGSKLIMSNYRPVSLLPVISKVLEKIVYKHMYSFLENENVLFQNQYGFRSHHSTIQAVTEFVCKTLKELEKNRSMIAVYLDLSKAFDTIDHSILLKKLDMYGIRGHALNWFNSYLQDRTQFTQISQKVSGKLNNHRYAVPQGSVLGPLLFLVYVNDIYKIPTDSSVICFADDTTVYVHDIDINIAVQTINRDLAKISDWFRLNKLSLNVGKTCYSIYSSNTNNLLNDVNINGIVIKRVKSTKFLGIYIDESLSWVDHVDYVLRQISPYVFVLQRFKNILSTESKRTIYNSFIHSILTYGVVLWGNATDTVLTKVKRKQKQAIKLVTSLFPVDFVDRCKLISVLPMKQSYIFEILKFSFCLVQKKTPPSIIKLFEFGHDVHQYNTQNRNFVRNVHHQKHKFNASVLNQVANEWRNVTPNIRSITVFHSFKKKLKNICWRTYRMTYIYCYIPR